MKTQEQEGNQFFNLSAVFYCLRVPSPRLLKFENVTFKVTELKTKIPLKVTANLPELILPKERSLLKLTYCEKMKIKSQIARELLKKRHFKNKVNKPSRCLNPQRA